MHLLLGLGNDLCAKFKDWIAQRIEDIIQEEKEAQNMSLLAEIEYDKGLVSLDGTEKELAILIEKKNQNQ